MSQRPAPGTHLEAVDGLDLDLGRDAGPKQARERLANQLPLPAVWRDDAHTDLRYNKAGRSVH